MSKLQKQKYLRVSWQGLIQQIVTLMSKGYIYFQNVSTNGKLSAERWLRIDKKMINRYSLLEINPKKRYRRKQAGLLNLYYLRYQDIAILFKTRGEFDFEVALNIWKSVFEESIYINVSRNLELRIGLKDGNKGKVNITCYLSNNLWKDIKAELFELIEHRKIGEVIYWFYSLNNIPRFHGLNRQKFELRKLLVKEAKRHGIKLSYDLL